MPATTRLSEPGRIAARYADHGWPVLPLHHPVGDGCSCRTSACGSIGKHPRTPRGVHEASIDPGQVASWWARWPDANVGVATGARSGLLVLDIDLPDGPTSLRTLQARHGRLPRTCSQTTGSGGRQLLFADPGTTIGNRTRVWPGVDVRGDGGYIVVPPSRHAIGDRYRWTVAAPPAPPPRWLLQALTRTHREPAHRHGTVGPSPVGVVADRYVAAAVDAELAQLAAAREGTRNDTLNRAAFNLGQLVGAGHLDPDRVSAALADIAHQIGLGAVETDRTIASGLTAGIARPRDLTPPAAARPARRR